VKRLENDGMGQVGRVYGTAVAFRSGRLDVIDLSSGQVARTLLDSPVEAAWLDHLQLSVDGRTVYAEYGTEDYWFDCDRSALSIVAIDVRTGEMTTLDRGSAPNLSPNGDQLMSLQASKCLTDPEQPEFVTTPIDTVSVRDIRSGDIRSFEIPGTSESTAVHINAVWGPNASVLVGVGDRLLQLETDTGAWTELDIVLDDRSPYREFWGYSNALGGVVVTTGTPEIGEFFTEIMGLAA
jgi:hypothetical protein